MAQAKAAAKKMDERELTSIVSSLVQDSLSYNDTVLSAMRQKATQYYKGEPFGNEEEGRSQFVMTEVRDAVLSQLPSLLRVFFGPERAVEFAPRTAEGVAIAAQATDAVQYTFAEDNKGFLETHACLKDGLVRKLGVLKAWYEEGEPETHLVVMPEDQILALVQSGQVAEILRAHDTGDGMVSAELAIRKGDGRIRIACIPPEEFLFSSAARDGEDALFVGHRRRLTRGQLIAMGVSEADIDAHGGDDPSQAQSGEAVERQEGKTTPTDPPAGDANTLHLYIEGYPRVDFDGDGIAELRKVCTLGPGHFVVSNTPCDYRPFAPFCPDPEAHTLVGQSFADRVMDLQLLSSSLVRGMNDSLALSIFPRMVYVEGQVNPQDMLNTEIGAPVRARAPGMVQEIKHTFAGGDILPVLGFLDGVREQRTGQNKGAMGLDADALQSSTAGAVGAAVTAAQAQTELVARIFAEMTLKPLFRIVYKLFVEHKPKARMMKLRGQWIEVNPASWDADMDVKVNVALGSALVEQKVATLAGIAAKQELILQTFGPNNPAVTLDKYVHTLRRAAELSGFPDSDSFFNPLPANFQMPQPPAPPDPNAMLVQIEQAKAQHAAMVAQAELQQKQAEWQARLAFEQQKHQDAQAHQQTQLAQDLVLKTTEYNLKYKTAIDLAQVQAEVDAAKHNRELALRAAETHTAQDVDLQKHAVEQAAADVQHQREMALGAHEAELAAKAAAAKQKSSTE